VLFCVSVNPPTLTDESVWIAAVERVPVVVRPRHGNTPLISVYSWWTSHLPPITVLDIYTNRTWI